MSASLIVILAAALSVAVLTLVREIRVRRALERLLQIILSRWRNRDHKNSNAGGGDRDRLPDGRL